MNSRFVKIIKNPFVFSLILAILIIVGLIYGTLVWLNSYTRHNEAVVVPDVKGLTMEKAVPFFESKGIHYNIIDSVFSKEVAPGAIVEIVPSAGSKVKQGRVVFVTINAKTSQMGVIPEVEDLSYRQAQALLTSLGFTSVEVRYVPGDYKDLAKAVEYNGNVLQKGQQIPLNAHLMLIVTSDEEMVDTIPQQFDQAPVESLDSEEEKWF